MGALILALNSGSSTVKYGLYAVDPEPALLIGGTIETADGHVSVLDALDAAVRDSPAPTAIGHRIVHGGPHRTAHCLIDDAVTADLVAACAFAPLHGPAALALIAAARARFPGLPQVACFDTAFHADLPDVAQVLPIPRRYRASGVRRYGFHGLSCESILARLGEGVPSRLVIAHLGNGASVTAVRDGRSVDTSMGLTPSGGVTMATRTGDIDPGILLYLLRETGLDAGALATLIDHESGMAGISGLSGDMRVLRAAAGSNPDADLAIRMFERSVCKQIAAMAATLGGLDLLVLTGGIGEHDRATQQAIGTGLEWLPGLATRIVASREDDEIARHAARLSQAAIGPPSR
ncbi:MULTISPECIES: acetate/propionate family kinase [unclassified Sphingomonas]|uniref:acetate/propionate family kinase n=1 Tax=unclassified Sphingomonas TaxID=196159 RepID=UPI000700BBD0|nr:MULTISPECIES: acetate kinase [unclassified Sphingomonas]KQN22535.1 acetate kinase [Sphingomonas sp. Leaf30]MBD8549125.1 acetate kinase [Sphingomonas sp. CFBP 8764]